MRKLIHRVTTIVRSIERLTDAVSVFVLSDPDDWDLPPWTAGSHIDVYLASGAVRQYSLCGRVEERGRYRVAVQREESGRGGSVSLHRDVQVGDILPVSLPRNHFPLVEARHHILLAGGIGITPLMSMAQSLRAEGASFELHHLCRSPEVTPFLVEVPALVGSDAVRHHFSQADGRMMLASLFDRLQDDDHLYCCGPPGLIAAVNAEAARRRISRFSTEAFGLAPVSGCAYEVKLSRSHASVQVAVGQSLLDALRAADHDIPASCEAGVCLECMTRVLEGTPLHRDITMTAAQRREFLTPCVSGSLSQHLTLDL